MNVNDINTNLLSYEGTLKELNIKNNSMNELFIHIHELMDKYSVASIDLIVLDTLNIITNELNLSFIENINMFKIVNQMDKRFKKGYISPLIIVECLIECIIYQYKKIYENRRVFNSFLRHEFTELILYGYMKYYNML